MEKIRKKRELLLWVDFRRVSMMANLECWIVMGDFNETLHVEGQIGRDRWMIQASLWLLWCKWSSLRCTWQVGTSHGQIYQWGRGGMKQNWLCLLKWSMGTEMAKCPLSDQAVLTVQLRELEKLVGQFHFLSSYLIQDDYQHVVTQAWMNETARTSSFRLTQKLKAVKVATKSWVHSWAIKDYIAMPRI